MGIESLLQQNMQNAGLAGTDRLARNAMFPQSQMDKTQYAVSTQMPTGAETINADYDAPTNAYTGLPTKPFANGGIAALRYDDGGDVAPPVEDVPPPTMAELADQLNEAYRTNSNYDQIWKDFEATKQQDPAEWYRKQLGFLGGQQGWQIGQNTAERNAALQPQVEDTIAQARAAGLNDDEISSVLGSSNQAANAENQRRIAQLAETGGSGFNFQKDLQPGLLMVGGAALGAYGLDAALAAAAAEGSLGTAAAMGPTYAELGYTPAVAEGLGGTAASQGMSLKDAYNAYKYGKMGLSALNAISGAGGNKTSGGYDVGYSGQGINPTAGPTGYNPNTMGGKGLGIADTYNPLATQPLFLSKLSEFKADQPAEMAGGGIADLGGYSDGGRLLRGPGDGMSDHIPASIGGKQPARLADGEFVVPADVVSHLGNGSTDAGAKQLYKMMDNIRKARTGNPKQGKQINPDKFTPKG